MCACARASAASDAPFFISAERVRDNGGHALVILDDLAPLAGTWDALALQGLGSLGQDVVGGGGGQGAGSMGQGVVGVRAMAGVLRRREGG